MAVTVVPGTGSTPQRAAPSLAVEDVDNRTDVRDLPPSRRARMMPPADLPPDGALRGISCLAAISLDHRSCQKPTGIRGEWPGSAYGLPVRTAQPAKASASSSNIRFATSIADIARGQPA
jgi:hypothetical protein